MKANFKLSKKLRLFLSIGAQYRVLTLGNRLPVSIRRRYRFSQTLVIYPESYYDFFMCNEVMCFLSLAKGLELESSVTIENGVPVIEITDYNVNDK